MRKAHPKLLATAFIALACIQPSFAETLQVRLSTPFSSIDPHYHNVTANMGIAQNIFDTLVQQDGEQQLQPGLALSWTPIDQTTWEFKLRDGVTFHDGSPFTAADVKFSIERIPQVESPGSYDRFVRQVKEIEIVDPLTIRFKTDVPFPLMPIYMANVVVVSKAAAEGKGTDDFNSGAAAIGTGPYKFGNWVPGESVYLVRNDSYWGDKPDFEDVNIQVIADDSARVTQLLTGGADFIDQVPPELEERVAQTPGLVVNKSTSSRFIYLGLNFALPEGSTMVTDANGQSLAENPLLDLRVRQAITKAIDRTTIVDRIMRGFAAPANQINLPTAGASPNQPADLYDPEGAKRLLAEAGYADGLTITLVAPNNSYINDAQLSQAIAQMLARVGIRVKLESVPSTVLVQRMNKGEFGMFMYGHGAATGEPTQSLNALVGSVNSDIGRGGSNRGKYANDELDALILQASMELDDAKRAQLAIAAIDMAMNDVAIVPLQHQFYVTAMKDTLNYAPRYDERFHAINVTKR